MLSKFNPFSKKEDSELSEEAIKANVASELEEAQAFAKTLDFDDVKNGQWFMQLLTKVVGTYDRNATADYFQKKYMGLPPDDIANKLTAVVVKYATIAGGIAGVAATANQITALSTAGMTAFLFVTTIGAEMIYLARIQMRFILDLSVVYDIPLDPDDPEDIMTIFGYALGIKPTTIIGQGLQKAAGETTKRAIKNYISKGTLKGIQEFAKRLGFKILQRTIIKYAVPVASAAVGSSYNYVTTKSLAQIAQNHFKSGGEVTDELRQLISRQNTYDLAFPAAARYMAEADGEFSDEEKKLYESMITRISLNEYDQEKFGKLISTEKNIIEAITQIEDAEMRQSLIDVLILMAIADGKLTEGERTFLQNISEQLGILVNISEIEQRTQDYQVILKEEGMFKKATNIAGDTFSKITTGASGTLKGVFGKAFKKKIESSVEVSTYTDVEQEYLALLKDCLEDGIISDDERRILNRTRDRLHISEERVVELENLARTEQYSPEEQEYIEELKFCLEDGEISTDERKFLERRQQKLGIPDERAKQLEQQLRG